MDSESSCTDDDNLTVDKICLITGKSSPETVVKLNAFALGVVTISSLERFTNLEIISLSLNKIETLKPFSGCRELRELHLRKNRVECILEIAHISKLEKLHTLLLSDNPCCATPKYRLKVVRTLKYLRRLDSNPITEEEILDANCVDDDLTMFERNVIGIVQKVDEGLRIIQDESKGRASDDKTDTKLDTRTDTQLEGSPHIHSNVLLAAKLLLLDMSKTEAEQLMAWCAEKLREYR